MFNIDFQPTYKSVMFTVLDMKSWGNQKSKWIFLYTYKFHSKVK